MNRRLNSIHVWNGELREKRGDTRVETIEKKYHVDLGVRGDRHLDTLLERKGVESLNDLIHGKPEHK